VDVTGDEELDGGDVIAAEGTGAHTRVLRFGPRVAVGGVAEAKPGLKWPCEAHGIL